jgi:hypothetical protein
MNMTGSGGQHLGHFCDDPVKVCGTLIGRGEGFEVQRKPVRT